MTRTGMKALEFALSDATRPLVVLGPSLGTSVSALWTEAAAQMTDRFDVLGWDLPGHGTAQPAPEALAAGTLQIADLAADVLELVAQAQAIRGDSGEPFFYAGVSVAGCVGLQLLLDQPERIAAAALICTGATIGCEADWQERADVVLAAGAASQITASAQRWFAAGFIERAPSRSSELLHSLRSTESSGYAAVCRALASFDVRAELGGIRAEVLVLSGAQDQATPPAVQRELAEGIPGARLEIFEQAGHLLPAEWPLETAAVLTEFFGASSEAASPDTASYRAGMRVRREVLGDAHVDRAAAATSEFGADFQKLITAYAWGEIWTRPGLDRRSRSMITLTALTAHGHWEELAMHVKAARGNGLSWAEIKEVLLQSAIYCSVPSANQAFKIAEKLYREENEAR